MSIEHGNFTSGEHWQQAERVQLVADFAQFLMEPGRSEIGGRVDDIIMERTPGKSYRLDDIEVAAYKAWQYFGGYAETIRSRATIDYAPAPTDSEYGYEELRLTIINEGKTSGLITTHDYRALRINDTVEGDYKHTKVPADASQDERMLARAHPDSRRMNTQDFSFLQQLLVELRNTQ